MAWYKDVYYDQDKLIPISFPKQILPGMFECMLSYLIDHELCPSVFDMHYNNDGQADHAMLKSHRDVYTQPKQTQRELQAVKAIKTKAKRLQRWLNNNNDNLGKGKPLHKKNITDNESVRMKTSKGVIQDHYV